MKHLTISAVLATAIACANGAWAAEFELTYSSPNPATHTYSLADQEWIARIEEQTDGRVKITPYWARSLITSREGVDELEAGIADLAYITPIYASAGFEMLRKTPAFFYGYEDPAYILEVFLDMAEAYPALAEEMEGVKVLGYNVGTPMHLLLREGPVETMEDMKGLRIRSANDYIGPLAAMGAEGVAMPMTDTYPALQRGVVDGVIANYETIKSLSFGEVAKFYTEIPHSRGAYPSRAMN
ncbi:TRAP transporter substrate-binding protein, partial [Oceanicola sp. S124]|uniref:TRAP transporter substrate-binding protein n=1 Tax=Oceanicola sp. S124 TaxID=1042378 RepID=UPI000255A45C